MDRLYVGNKDKTAFQITLNEGDRNINCNLMAYDVYCHVNQKARPVIEETDFTFLVDIGENKIEGKYPTLYSVEIPPYLLANDTSMYLVSDNAAKGTSWQFGVMTDPHTPPAVCRYGNNFDNYTPAQDGVLSTKVYNNLYFSKLTTKPVCLNMYKIEQSKSVWVFYFKLREFLQFDFLTSKLIVGDSPKFLSSN